MKQEEKVHPAWKIYQKQRGVSEEEGAKILQLILNEKGQQAFLAECKSVEGWSRRTAYRHLNPEAMQQARDDAKAAREAKVPTVGTQEVEDPEEEEPEEEEFIKPEKQLSMCIGYIGALHGSVKKLGVKKIRLALLDPENKKMLAGAKELTRWLLQVFNDQPKKGKKK